MKKFLPIGTVCTIKESDNKFLIVGFQQNNCDYEALYFPEGTTNGKGYKQFNHDDINEVYSLGYKDESTIEYLNSFNPVVVSVGAGSYNETAHSTSLGDLQFNEDGVVVAQSNVPVQEKKESQLGELTFDENGVVIAQSNAPVQEKQESQFGELTFDENGVVIAQSNAPVQEKKESQLGELTFDENGVVIAQSNAPVQEKRESQLGNLQFDENGVVISDGNNTLVVNAPNENKSSLGKLIFDENGLVVAQVEE